MPYWLGKLSDGEKDRVRNLIGHNSYRSDAESAVDYAIAHEFYRNSVVPKRRLYETAIRHGIGSVTPEEIEAAAKRQGVVYAGDECSTQGVLDQEDRIVGFAREGKGLFRPLGAGRTDGLEGLSTEQAAAVRHVRNSRDQMMLIRGGAGGGQDHHDEAGLRPPRVPAVLLAPSSDASRGKLRQDGFEDANTVAAFLGESASEAMRESVKAASSGSMKPASCRSTTWSSLRAWRKT